MYKSSWTEYIDNVFQETTQVSVLEQASDSKSVFDVSPISGHTLFIQMELCQMTLKDAISKINDELEQRIGELVTVIGALISTHFTSEILDGVHYLHSLKPPIIHRDLKPSNIFITNGRGGTFIKIGDMGSAIFHNNIDDDDDDDDDTSKQSTPSKEYTRCRGTVEYMAPEVYNSTEYDEKCDAYSLGRIMMDLFCIRKALDPKESEELVNQMKDPLGFSKSKVASSLHFYLNEIIQMLKDPSNRKSVSDVYKTKNRWLININDLIEDPKFEPQLCRIALNEKHLDKINMNPLSQYIVINKLRIEKDRQILINWNGTIYNEIYDVILSGKIRLYSNCSVYVVRYFMDIIKRAFLLCVSKESICMYIGRQLSDIETQWICTCKIDILNLTGSDHISVIDWGNKPYIYAYHQPLDLYIVATPIQKDVIAKSDELSLPPHSIPPQISFNRLVKQVINSFDDDITLKLIDMVSVLVSIYAYDFHNLEFSRRNILLHHQHDLKDIRELIEDDTAQCYMSVNDKIVICNSYNCDIICKYAAIIPEFGFSFAIFTVGEVSHTDASQHPHRTPENIILEKSEFDNFILIQGKPTDHPESQISNIS